MYKTTFLVHLEAEKLQKTKCTPFSETPCSNKNNNMSPHPKFSKKENGTSGLESNYKGDGQTRSRLLLSFNWSLTLKTKSCSLFKTKFPWCLHLSTNWDYIKLKTILPFKLGWLKNKAASSNYVKLCSPPPNSSEKLKAQKVAAQSDFDKARAVSGFWLAHTLWIL